MKKETAFRSLVLFAFLSVFLAMSAQDKKESDVAEVQNRTVLPVARISASDKEETLNRGIINYDYVWEYVYSPGGGGGSPRVEHYSFVGEKDVEGTTYHSFKCIELYDNDGKCDLTAGIGTTEYLLREDTDEGKVWACVAKDHPYFSDDIGPYTDHEEMLIYDFNQKDGETYGCARFMGKFWYPSCTGEWIYGGEPDKYGQQFFVQDDEELVVDGKVSRVINIVTPINDGERMYVNNTLIEGIGCIKGILPVVPYDFYDNGQIIFFTRLLKPDGAVVYEDPDFTDGPVKEWVDDVLSGIRNVSEDSLTAPADRLYDLQGRELREAVPGQPYIKGGKVFVETK